MDLRGISADLMAATPGLEIALRAAQRAMSVVPAAASRPWVWSADGVVLLEGAFPPSATDESVLAEVPANGADALHPAHVLATLDSDELDDACVSPQMDEDQDNDIYSSADEEEVIDKGGRVSQFEDEKLPDEVGRDVRYGAERGG